MGLRIKPLRAADTGIGGKSDRTNFVPFVWNINRFVYTERQAAASEAGDAGEVAKSMSLPPGSPAWDPHQISLTNWCIAAQGRHDPSGRLGKRCKAQERERVHYQILTKLITF